LFYERPAGGSTGRTFHKDRVDFDRRGAACERLFFNSSRDDDEPKNGVIYRHGYVRLFADNEINYVAKPYFLDIVALFTGYLQSSNRRVCSIPNN